MENEEVVARALGLTPEEFREFCGLVDHKNVTKTYEIRETLSPDDEARYAALSDRMEAEEYQLSPRAAAAAPFTDYSDELDKAIFEENENE